MRVWIDPIRLDRPLPSPRQAPAPTPAMKMDDTQLVEATATKAPAVGSGLGARHAAARRRARQGRCARKPLGNGPYTAYLTRADTSE